MARISVLLATYNGALFLVRQMDSILSQTLQPSEIIVSDDGSTDDTFKILAQYTVDPRIVVVSNRDVHGVVGNFQNALRHATPGNFIAFCDQDDIWLPNKLELLLPAISRLNLYHKFALVYSDLEVIDHHDFTKEKSFWRLIHADNCHHNFYRLFSYGNFVTGCTMIVSYDLANCLFDLESSKNRGLKEGLFHDYWLAALAFGLGATSAEKAPLVKYRQHDKNLTFAVGTLFAKPANPLTIFAKNVVLNPQIHQSQILLASRLLNLYGSRFNWRLRLYLHSIAALSYAPYLIRRLILAAYQLLTRIAD